MVFLNIIVLRSTIHINYVMNVIIYIIIFFGLLAVSINLIPFIPAVSLVICTIH